MLKEITSLSQRGAYKPNNWDRFTWWLSTATQQLLADCVVDRDRYRIIGLTVLATWSFATLAWTYFWTTVTSSWWLSLLLGLFMGAIILTIDRALIKGMNKFNKNKVVPFAVRGLLALTLGTFMAQPAILFMFDKEIKVQVSLDNEGRKKAKQQQVDSLYAGRKQNLLNERNQLTQNLDSRYNEVGNARQQFLAEIDGTGGSGQVGIKSIARTKQAEYERLNNDYNQLEATTSPQLKSIDSSLHQLQNEVKTENDAYAALLNNGFLTRIAALNNLVATNPALRWRYLLVVVILMLIELMPVLAKSLLPSGTYDEKVKMTEALEQEMSQSNMRKEQELKELYNSMARQHDEVFIRDFFDATQRQRKEKLLQKLQQWQKDDDQPFDDFWERVKKEILTKQEN